MTTPSWIDPARPTDHGVYRLLGWHPRNAHLPSLPKSRYFRATAALLSAALAAHLWDRRKAAQVKHAYVQRVAHFADLPMQPHELPRKAHILTSKIPDDPEDDRTAVFFKRYVKPVLVAAGWDYTLSNGTEPGGIARLLRDRIRQKRIAGLHPEQQDPFIPGMAEFVPTYYESLQKNQLLPTLIVGRHTMKEYFWALREGYFRDFDMSLETQTDQEKEDSFQYSLDLDGTFGDVDAARAPPIPPTAILPALDSLPPQSHIGFLPFDHPLGSMRWWPQKIFSWLFLEHRRMEQGCEAALALIEAQTRPIEPPTNQQEGLYVDLPEDYKFLDAKDQMLPLDTEITLTGSRDLDLDWQSEWHYRNTFFSTPHYIEETRKDFYRSLPDLIKTARELSSGERAPTEAELTTPPKTIEELAKQRAKKERIWRRDVDGWKITRPGSGVIWDDRFRDLKVLKMPKESVA